MSDELAELKEHPELEFYRLCLTLVEYMKKTFNDGEIIIEATTKNEQSLIYRRQIRKKTIPQTQFDLVKVAEKLSESLALTDVQNLAFRLSKDYDDLDGQTKKLKIQSLVKDCEYNGHTEKLINECCRLRPNIDWSNMNTSTL